MRGTLEKKTKLWKENSKKTETLREKKGENMKRKK